MTAILTWYVILAGMFWPFALIGILVKCAMLRRDNIRLTNGSEILASNLRDEARISKQLAEKLRNCEGRLAESQELLAIAQKKLHNLAGQGEKQEPPSKTVPLTP